MLAKKNPSEYVLKGGKPGAERLKLLSSAYWPTTKTFLETAGIKKGIQFLDIGCGAGDLLIRVARMLERKGQFFGIDIDNHVLEIANDEARNAEISLELKAMNIETHEIPKLRESLTILSTLDQYSPTYKTLDSHCKEC